MNASATLSVLITGIGSGVGGSTPAATGGVRNAWVSGGGLCLAWMAGGVADGCGDAASRRVSLLYSISSLCLSVSLDFLFYFFGSEFGL